MLGQRKLLQRLGPGLIARVHLLGLPGAAADDPDRDDRRRRQARDAPVARPSGLVSRSSSTCSRCSCWSAWSARCGSARSSGPRRFEGSHLGEADLILALIATIVDDAAAVARARGSRSGSTSGRRRRSPVSNALSHLFGRQRADARARARVRLGPRADDPRRSSPTCRAPSTCTSPRAAFNVWFGRTRARRPARAAALRRSGRARGGDPVRRRHRRRPDLEAGARHVLVHRVRALPGRLPGVRDRQDRCRRSS